VQNRSTSTCAPSIFQTPPAITDALGSTVRCLVALIGELNRQITALEAELARHFAQHPDAEIIRSLPGLGPVLGARVLGEFGDDPSRYADAKSRKNYAGTSPITKASGITKVVLARFVRNRRLGDACYLWAFSALSNSPGARALYDTHRAKQESHDQALRAVANRLVGILHGCLKHRALYDESVAWPSKAEPQTAAA
jgi:transposase